MADRPDGLRTWQQLLERRRDDAGRALAEQRHHLGEEQARLQSLEGFRRDYLDRLAGGTGEVLSVADLQRCQHYLANIEQAIGQQAVRIHQAEQQVADCQAGLSAVRRQELSVQGVVDSRERAARARADKLQQAQLDELASQAHGRRLRRAEAENLD